MSGSTRRYRFGDASLPGVLLGLPLRQAAPVIAGVVWLAACLQTPLGAIGGLAGLAAGVTVAFGRWGGAPLVELVVPAARVVLAARLGRGRWHRSPLLDAGDGAGESLPPQLAGLEVVEASEDGDAVTGAAGASRVVVWDRRRRRLTAVVRVVGRGFPLATAADQDRLLAGWGAALSPFAHDRSPVVRVTWQAWAGPDHLAAHREFLAATHTPARDESGGSLLDYLTLVDEQAATTRAHQVLVTVTVDERRARRRAPASRGDGAVEVLLDEVDRFCQRLDAASLTADPAGVTADDLRTALRLRSDPGQAARLTTLAGSLAAAAGRGRMEWGPMVVEPAWGHVRVDGSYHRTYRVAGWPQLPVPADWLAPLLGESTATRTVCVVMEPVPVSRSARAADREAMAREADADSKARRGFRATALDRKRLGRVEDRERELAEGHAEFRFVGLVDVTASDLAGLEEASAAIEQAAAQSLIDLRPLDGRHAEGWVACLPVGRDIASRGDGR